MAPEFIMSRKTLHFTTEEAKRAYRKQGKARNSQSPTLVMHFLQYILKLP